jgi:hypothetical protein
MKKVIMFQRMPRKCSVSAISLPRVAIWSVNLNLEERDASDDDEDGEEEEARVSDNDVQRKMTRKMYQDFRAQG